MHFGWNSIKMWLQWSWLINLQNGTQHIWNCPFCVTVRPQIKVRSIKWPWNYPSRARAEGWKIKTIYSVQFWLYSDPSTVATPGKLLLCSFFLFFYDPLHSRLLFDRSQVTNQIPDCLSPLLIARLIDQALPLSSNETIWAKILNTAQEVQHELCFLVMLVT